jgi:hypothetical protein
MTAAVALALVAVIVLGWTSLEERRRSHRWREAERLSRCLFAAAGMRRRRR